MEQEQEQQLERITFEGFVKVQIHCADKNSAYIHSFLSAGCDPSTQKDIHRLNNSTINSNLLHYRGLFEIEPQFHARLHTPLSEELHVREPKQITTEEWVNLTDLVSNAEHYFQAYYQILQTLIKEDVSIEVIKDLDYKEAAEVVTFFLLNLKKFTHIFLLSLAAKNQEKMFEMLQVGLEEQNLTT